MVVRHRDSALVGPGVGGSARVTSVMLDTDRLDSYCDATIS